MKRAPIVIIMLAVVGVAAWWSVKLRTKPLSAYKEQNLHRLQSRGQLPDLPGPYLQRGDIRDLKYEFVDVGIASSGSFDSQGNLNLDYFGAKVTTVPVRDADGVLVNKIVIPEPKKMQFMVAGSLVPQPVAKEIYTISDFTNGSELLKDGKPFYRPSRETTVVSDPGSRVYVQEDCMFYSPELVMNRDGGSVFVNSEGKLEQIPAELGKWIRPVGSADGLGTVCTRQAETASSKERIYLYHDHRWTEVKLPYASYQHRFYVTQNRLYISDAFNPSQSVYAVEKDAGIRALMPPPNSNGITLTSANSRGDAIFETVYRLPKAKGFDFYGITRRSELIIGNKFYDLCSLLKAKGVEPNVYGGRLESGGINERGDFFVIVGDADLPHLYLFRRKQ